MEKARILLVLVIVLLPALLAAWPSYQSMSTPNFEVFYRTGWETEALNVLQAMEYSRPYVEKLTGNKLGKIPYVIEDPGNMVNGYASPIGTKIAVFAYPPSGNELSFSEDWWQLVGMHEYIHMAQMTKIGGEPAILRALFGNILYPNLYQPMWMTEGITVYGESNISPYSGRMKGGTYPAIISTLAREGKLPSPSKAGYMSYDTPLAHYYVFGGSFYQYLADTYGQDKFSQLFEYTGSTLASYLNPLTTYLSIDKAYETAYGKPLTTLWLEWQAKETTKPFALPKENLTSDGWHASNLTYHNGALYYVSNKVDKTGPSSGFSSYKLIRMTDLLASPQKQVILEQDTEFPAGFHVLGNKIYYSRSEYQSGYDNNDFDGLGAVSEIWQMNLDGSIREKLTKGQYRAFCPLDNGKLLLSSDNATHRTSIILEWDPATKATRELFRLQHLVSGIFTQNGKYYVTARGFWSNNSIYEMDIKSGKLSAIIDTPSMENIVSLNGNDLIFEAVYNGENGCYLRKIDNGQIFRFTGVSEVTSLAMGPGGDTWFISMSSKGQDVYGDKLKLQPFQLPNLPRNEAPFPRLEYGKDDMIMNTYPVQYGGYTKNVTHALWPRLYRFPYIEGREDSLVVGVMMAGSDILGDFPWWNATVLYDSYKKQWGMELGLDNYFFRPVKNSLLFQLDFDGNRQLNSTQYVSLLTRMNYGLQNAWTGFGFQLWDKEKRKMWYPFVGMNFAWAGGELQTNNSLLYETTDFLASDRDRLGWQGRAVLRQRMPMTSEFRGRIQAGWDPNANVGDVFSPIRGYDDDWAARKGITLSASWYKPILKIRDALWTPNIYFGDLSMGLFYDQAIPWNEPLAEVRSSVGAELLLELQAAYMFSLDLGLRASFPDQGEPRLDLILGTDF